LTPVENVWQYLRANWLAISVFDDYPAIVDACCQASNRFADDPKTVASITDRQWAQVDLQGHWYHSSGRMKRWPWQLKNPISRSTCRAGARKVFPKRWCAMPTAC